MSGTMSDMGEPSEDLMDLVFTALDHAVDSIEGGGPLIPFLLVESDDGERRIHRFPGDLEEGQHQARETARSVSGHARAAVAWDGYLTLDDVRTDALFVEASEAGDAESVLIGQRYEMAGRIRKKIQPLGNPGFLPPGEPLF